MSDTESLDYLQPAFDPNSLTMPRLRSILVSHNVNYSSGAKKAQLIDILTDQVLPHSKKILKERAKIRRESKGIVNDGDSQDDEEDMPPPKPRATSGRRTTRTPRASSRGVKVEESEEENMFARPRSPTKRASSKHARISDTSEDGMRSVRRTRKSESVTAAPERYEVEETLPVKKENRRESAFTYDNPFQSGSSPPVEPKRKSLGTPATKEKKRVSSTIRRRTETPQADDGFRPPTSATFEVPVSALNGLKSVDDNGVEASEEFTPEEQMELVRERSEKGISAVGPLRPRATQPRKFNWKSPAGMTALVATVAAGAWYRQEKINVGYCGIGREAESTSIIPATITVPESITFLPDTIDVPEWLRFLPAPECEACPQHAYCDSKFQVNCESGFDLQHHPLSLGGLIPLVPTCEPNGILAKKVKSVADTAVKELEERRAKFECGDLLDDKGFKDPIVEIEADELKKMVKEKTEKLKALSNAEFESLWVSALGDVEAREEVVSAVDGPRTTLTSTSLARLSIRCSLRRSVRNTLAAYRLYLGSIVLSLCLGLYGRNQLITHKQTKAKIPQLVSMTLDRLANQAALHREDREIEGYVAINQLRDDVLRDIHSISKREAIWQLVRRNIEMNSNVRSAQRETRSGEVSRVWEWIGAIAELEDGSGGRRRKSGRVSWGHYGAEENGGNSSPVSGTDGGSEMVQSKWAEGRPVY